jgi:eukaryotic-like serine/threonine-protein kinase
MTCSSCHTSNPDDALRCAKCGAAFAGQSAGQTAAGEGAAAPRGSPAISKPSAAAGVATPTPGSGSNAPTLDGSVQVSSGFSMALEPGSQFGPRYRIESLLGRGGMGAVYKAYDKELDRIVALKLVRPELTVDPSTMQRFKQELLLASKISHKNILRIHDLGEVGGTKFISMAYVEGEDLQHLLKKGRPPLERALSIARQLTAALEAAHAEGVVHRDLKPQNVLVDRAGTAYVSDFGLAKSLEAEAAGMTRTGQVLGTPRYMSPEQVEAKPADHRSDLYSLGLIFYEMVTGMVPFVGDSALQVMYQRLKEKPKNPKQFNPELPDYLARLIMRCLEKDPARRYQSAREILQDLEAERSPSFSRTVQISVPALPQRGWLLAVGGVLALVILVLAIRPLRRFMFRTAPANAPTSEARPTPGQQKYLAVLPFRVAGDQASLNYVAQGLMEALSAKLFQLSDVHVASTTAVEKASKNVSLEKTARELGVNLLIQGTLQGSGEKMRIVVNLEDVAGGRRLWSQEFSGVSQDLLTLEDQIYAQLVAALKLRPSQDELARSSSHPTENIEAYDLYLKGRNAMRGEQDVKNIETAIRFYEDALKRDSGFALAYAGIADASLLMYREKKDSFWAQKALAAAQQAQRLNDRLAEVHSSLGSVYDATGKTAEAAAELKHALELSPNSDEGYRRLGDNFLARGRKDESIQAYQKAVQINPYYWINYNALGQAYFQLGDNDKALTAFRRVTELETDNAVGHENVGAVYFRQGKYNECIPFFRKALELQPRSDVYSDLGTAYFFLRRYAEAVPMFEKAVEMKPNEEVWVGNLADAYRWAGQPEKAKATYDKAIALAYKELEVNPRNPTALESLALYYAKKGEAAQGLEFIRRARDIDPNNNQFIYSEAMVQTLAGRRDEALKTLREAFRKGYSTEEANRDPELKSLQNSPEFEKLIREFSRKTN